MYNYGARFYDPKICVFPSIDRFAEKFSYQSPYTYAGNNPSTFIDINRDSLSVPVNDLQAQRDLRSMLPKSKKYVILSYDNGRVKMDASNLTQK